MTAGAAQPDPTRFLASRPADLHVPRPWHPLSYIVRRLHARVDALSAELDLPAGARILDYGCADAPYRHLFAHADYQGADLPGNPNATLEIRPDGTLPVPDASFDAILSTQVLEHVNDPGLYLSECYRVLRPGGRLLLTTHGIMVYHPDPVDYWRWTCAGLRRAVAEAGFEIERFEGIMGLAATGLQLVQDATYYYLPRPLRPVYALFLQSLIALVDRVQSWGGRDLNALVFAVIARKA